MHCRPPGGAVARRSGATGPPMGPSACAAGPSPPAALTAQAEHPDDLDARGQRQAGPEKSPAGGGAKQRVRSDASNNRSDDSVDQTLTTQGLDAVVVLAGGATGLFGLTGQLTGGGDGHGSASGKVLRIRGRGGWRVASGRPPEGAVTYFRRCGSTGQR